MSSVQAALFAALALIVAFSGCRANRLQGGPHYFSSWSGYNIPQKPVGSLEPDELEERTTYYEAYFDDRGRLVRFTKFYQGSLLWSDEYTYPEEGGVWRTHTAADGSTEE